MPRAERPHAAPHSPLHVAGPETPCSRARKPCGARLAPDLSPPDTYAALVRPSGHFARFTGLQAAPGRRANSPARPPGRRRPATMKIGTALRSGARAAAKPATQSHSIRLPLACRITSRNNTELAAPSTTATLRPQAVELTDLGYPNGAALRPTSARHWHRSRSDDTTDRPAAQ